MSLQRAIGGWCRGLERDWMNIRRELPVDVEKAGARPGHARHAIAGWPYGAPAPVLATPSTATRDLTPLAVLVDHAVRDEETDNVQRYERVTIVQLTPLDLGNALECVGIPLDPASWDTMRAWLPRMEVRRDDERAAYWWTAGCILAASRPPFRMGSVAIARSSSFPWCSRHGAHHFLPLDRDVCPLRHPWRYVDPEPSGQPRAHLSGWR